MNEYQARIKSVANEIISMRSTSGATSSILMFGLFSLMLSKNKITEKDLDIIMQLEKDNSENTLKDLFTQNYGDSTFEINNEAELDDVVSELHLYVDNIKNFIVNAAEEINPPKKTTTRKRKTYNEG